jgi:5-methylcytosine-specific restriction endonuclease McrA
MVGWTSAIIRREIRNYVFEREKGMCFYCGRMCEIAKTSATKENTATIDHIISRANGGNAKDISNCVLSCLACNNEKADKDAFSFLKAKMVSATLP